MIIPGCRSKQSQCVSPYTFIDMAEKIRKFCWISQRFRFIHVVHNYNVRTRVGFRVTFIKTNYVIFMNILRANLASPRAMLSVLNQGNNTWLLTCKWLTLTTNSVKKKCMEAHIKLQNVLIYCHVCNILHMY